MESFIGFRGMRWLLRIAEVRFDEAMYERAEGFAGLCQDEAVGCQVKFEAGVARRDPDLLDGSVGRDYEFAGRLLKNDVERAGVGLDLKTACVLGSVELLGEFFNGGVCFFAKLNFIDHAASVTICTLAVR